MILRYVGKRLLQAVPTVAGIVVIAFFLIHLAPGDPIFALAGEHGDAAYYAFMRDRFGLDRPLPEQFFTFVGRVARGDIGVSFVHGRPAADVIADRVFATALLMLTALAISTLVGLLLGVLGATRADRATDRVITTGVLGLYAAPVFWVGQIAVLLLAFHLGLFPVQGFRTPGLDAAGLAGVLDVAHHLALPALVLASQEIAAVTRLTRSVLGDELDKDYVRTARAMGLRERVVIARYGLPRTLLPVVTIIGTRAGYVLGGAVIVEIVFAWPGIGRLLLGATQARDMPVLLGLFLLVSITVVLANLITDLVYAVLDPRIRYR